MLSKRNTALIIFSLFLLIPVLSLFLFHASLTPLLHISEQLVNTGKGYWQEPIFYLKNGGYDGQYYYLNMYDLWNNTKAIPDGYHIRIFFPALIYGICHLIKIESASAVLFAVNFVALLASWQLLNKIYRKYDIKETQKFWFLNIGILTAFKYGLTEPLALFFMVAALFFYEFCKNKFSLFLFFISLSLVLLTRDAFVFLMIGLGTFLLIQRKWGHVVATIFSLLPFLIVKNWLMNGKEIKEQSVLFKWDSVWQFGFNSGLLNSILCFLFLAFLCGITVKIIFSFRSQFTASPYALMSLFSLLFLGFFNPTSAWTNVTGIGRHLVCLFPFLPLAFGKASFLKEKPFILEAGNILFILVFYVWFFKSLFQEYQVFLPT